jgi:hypothetical protein
MSEINITLKGLEENVQRLRAFPGAAKWSLTHAILYALRGAKTEVSKAVRAKYAAPLKYVRDAIGRPVMNNLSGYLRVSGSKLPLEAFPHQERFPGGIRIEEVRDKMTVIRHAFSTHIYQRKSAAVKKYPIGRVFGLSVPQMAGNRALPSIRERLERDLNNEYQRLLRLIIAGKIEPK